MSWLFTSGGQSVGASASALVFPMNVPFWFPLGLTDFSSLLFKGLSRVFSSTTVQRHQSFNTQPFYCPAFTSIHDYWKNNKFENMDLCRQSTVSAFKYTLRFVIVTCPRSKHLLISCLKSQFEVILEPEKMKSVTVCIVSPSIFNDMIGPDAMIFIFKILSFKPAFSLSSFTFIKRLFSCSSLSAIRVVSSEYLRLLILLPGILISDCASSSLAFCMNFE